MQIGKQLKGIMENTGVGIYDLLDRLGEVGGNMTAKRLTLLLSGLSASGAEVQLIATALNIPEWELTDGLNSTQRENKTRLHRFLKEKNRLDLFDQLLPFVSQSVQYRDQHAKPVDEYVLRDLLNQFLDHPEEFEQDDDD